MTTVDLRSRPARVRIRTVLLATLGLAVLTVGSTPTVVRADEPVTKRGDLVSVFGGDILIPSHVRQRGSVVSVGGNVTIEGEVSQDVVVILGSLKLSGTVDGNVTGVLSELEVDGARIDEQFVGVLGNIQMRDTSVGSEFINILSSIDRDNLSTPPVINIIGFGAWVPSLTALLTWLRLFRLVAIFLLLLLIAAMMPERVRLIGEEAPTRYVQAFLVGILGYLGVLVAFTLLAATVVGLPFFFIGYYLLKWLGVAGIFYAIGHRIGRSFGREMSLLGAVLLSFAVLVLVTLAPTPLGLLGLPLSGCLRVLFFLLVEVPAIGLVLMTRIGTQRAADRLARRQAARLASPPAPASATTSQIAPSPPAPPVPPVPPASPRPPSPPIAPSSPSPPRGPEPGGAPPAGGPPGPPAPRDPDPDRNS